MNLPKISDREFVVREASIEFSSLCQEALNIYAKNLDLGQVIEAYNQIIINLFSETKVTHNDFQKEIEKALELLVNKYQITLGEKMLLITEKSINVIHSVISWERKNK